jgi:hypothetical protein
LSILFEQQITAGFALISLLSFLEVLSTLSCVTGKDSQLRIQEQHTGQHPPLFFGMVLRY